MKTVIKLGGSVLADDTLRGSLVSQVAELHRRGRRVVVVHGGGKQIAAMLEKLGIESSFYDGLRVTDAAAREVIQMVLAGQVGKNLVAEFARVGIRAASFTGADGMTLLSERLKAADGTDLGYVGQVTGGNGELIEAVVKIGMIPVVACLAFNAGDFLLDNVNGDQMAASVAALCGASDIIYVTDVGGVRDGSGKIIPRLNLKELKGLLSSGVASGGMRPKLRSCEAALNSGIAKVQIVGAATENSVLRAFEGDETTGTVISEH